MIATIYYNTQGYTNTPQTSTEVLKQKINQIYGLPQIEDKKNACTFSDNPRQ